MSPASLAPEQDLHFVLCDFARSGQAYVETDPSQADASTIVRNLLDGQYNRNQTTALDRGRRAAAAGRCAGDWGSSGQCMR
jgi:hypothetical protein